MTWREYWRAVGSLGPRAWRIPWLRWLLVACLLMAALWIGLPYPGRYHPLNIHGHLVIVDTMTGRWEQP